MGLDIAKNEIVACVRWGQGCFERPWKIVNTTEIGLLIELCLLLKSKCDGFSVGLESTGTYGDAVRFALTEAAISVQRVSGNAVSDYMEIFDGVPSQHDGKDAAMVAELVAMGKGSLWPYSALSENIQVINHHVRRIDNFRSADVSRDMDRGRRSLFVWQLGSVYQGDWNESQGEEQWQA